VKTAELPSAGASAAASAAFRSARLSGWPVTPGPGLASAPLPGAELGAVAVEPSAALSAEDLSALEPSAADPVAVDPVAADPVPVDPVAVDPVAVDPVAADPVALDPVAVDPVAVEEAADAAGGPASALEPLPAGVSQENAGSSESPDVSRRGSGCGPALWARAGVSSFTAASLPSCFRAGPGPAGALFLLSSLPSVPSAGRGTTPAGLQRFRQRFPCSLHLPAGGPRVLPRGMRAFPTSARRTSTRPGRRRRC
jgi:hypothetical protein